MRIVVRLIGGVLALTVASARAEVFYQGNFSSEQPMSEYFGTADFRPTRSIIYLFYDNDSCYSCPQTMLLTQQIYNRFYASKYDFYTINRAENFEYDYTTAYHLTAPLAIVLVRVSDGAEFGFLKIQNPQNFYDTPENYTYFLTSKINTFFEN